MTKSHQHTQAAHGAPHNPHSSSMRSPSLSLRISRWLLAGILIFCAVAYAPTLMHGFVYDDPLVISENPLIRSLSPANICAIFSSTLTAMYMPLTILCHAVEYALWGVSPIGYHAVNILFHLLNIALVFYLVMLLFNDRRIGLVAALLFGIHPINVETVAWLSCRSSVLYGSFFLLSFISYVYYVKTSGGRRIWFYASSIALFTLALLAKSAAMALPPLLFAYDYFLRRSPRPALIWEKIPYFALAVIAAFATIKIRGSGGYIADLSHIYSPIDRLFMVCYSFGFYPFKALFPFSFSAFYPFPVKSNGALPFIYYAAPFLLAGAGVLLYRLIKDRRLFAFLVLLYAIPVALSLQFVPVGKLITADRYAYIPCIGMWCLAAHLAVKYRRFRIVRYAVAPLALAFLTATTVMQSQIWKNNLSLWTDVIAKAPLSDMGYLNHAIALCSGPVKDYRTAFDDCNKAISLRSAFSNTEMAYNNRGNIEKEIGAIRAALADYDSAIQCQPDFIIALKNRAELRRQTGALGPSLDDYSAALRIEPRNIDLLLGKGMTALMAEDFSEAASTFSAALSTNPGFYPALNGRAIAESRLGDYGSARRDFALAIRIEPKAADAYTNQGIMENDMGDFPSAIGDLNHALELDPRDIQALVNRAIAERKMGDFDRALADLSAAHAMDTAFLPVFYERGLTHYAQGRYVDAAAALSALLARAPGYRDGWYYAGLTFKKLNDRPKALACLKKAAELGKKEAFDLLTSSR
ncbi:MAG: tetratricopeptide repeat protein [Chitinispirillaceae bacterium]